ncbi:MAG: hypothetical protein U0326_16395 [Polyangiales bacterium]
MRRAPHASWFVVVAALAPATSLAQTSPAEPPAAQPPTPAVQPPTLAAQPPTLAAQRPRATTPPAEAQGPLLRVSIPGELQLRYTAFTTFPLATTPGVPATVQPPNLGQNQYFEHWIRLRPSVTYGDRLRLGVQLDVARLVVPDAAAQGVGLAREPRTELFPYGVVDLRTAFLEWRSPIGVIRAGQQAFNLALGIVANDGDRAPTFGDYRYGDLVERVSIATRPGGSTSDYVLALAGDLVFRDRLVKLTDGDIALQGVASFFWQDHACQTDCERKRVGLVATYRDVSFNNGATLWAVAGDAFARWSWPQPDHVGRVFAGVELAFVYGATDVARTQYYSDHRVIQFGGAAEFGLEREGRYRISLEAGYASGDRNPVDGDQRRFTFNPSHRVGLLMFPEVLAWQTARSAAIASDPALGARPSNGAFLLPSQGGVAGAAYLYPTALVNVGRNLDLRAGAVIGVATTDVVDPVSVQLYGTSRNYRGGDTSHRDLGVELDLGINGRFPLPGGAVLTGGVQGAVMFPGHAFDDATGACMGTQALASARMGVSF